MGIMRFAGTVLKNLIHEPATLMYPQKQRKYHERTRGHIEIDREVCIYCGMCERKCPCGAIKVTRTEKQWDIEVLRCIQCGACVENCPKKCLFMNNQYSQVVVKDDLEVVEEKDNSVEIEG